MTTPDESIDADDNIDFDPIESVSNASGRRARLFASSQRRSKIVRLMRLGFPVLAVILLFAVLIFNDRRIDTEIRNIKEVVPKTMGKNELVNPRFESQDEKAQPYVITAERAFQADTNMDEIRLEKPTADMTMNDGTWVAIKSIDGLFDQKNQLLDLKGNVRMYHDSGYLMTTKAMLLDIRNKTADSDTPVTVKGPAADLTAQGLSADGQSAILIFKGPAHLTLHSISGTSENKTEKPEPPADFIRTTPTPTPETGELQP
ncbi:MAG: LPS export ABC transporter periplasmic protein LptC [Pseudobdellovibrionaceae bacterium]